MIRVTGIGGVFIRAKDPTKLRSWYKTHLGIDVQEWGGAAFRWADAAGAPAPGTTVWSIGDGSQFAPSNATFMVGVVRPAGSGAGHRGAMFRVARGQLRS